MLCPLSYPHILGRTKPTPLSVKWRYFVRFFEVSLEGLEPSCLSTLVSETSAYAFRHNEAVQGGLEPPPPALTGPHTTVVLPDSEMGNGYP